MRNNLKTDKCITFTGLEQKCTAEPAEKENPSNGWRIFKRVVVLIDRYLPILVFLISDVFVLFNLMTNPFFAWGEEAGAVIFPFFMWGYAKIVTTILRLAVWNG